MDIFQAIILGIVQGITEWIPISSSGHLVLVQQYLGLGSPVAFDALLHLASVLVIALVFWKDILMIGKSLFTWKWDENTRLLVLIIVASIPTGIMGLVFKDFFTALFSNMIVLGICFIINGIILILTLYAKDKNKSLSWKSAFLMGVAQGISIVPSISRSGITIATGLFMGIRKERLIKFSFLMAVPAILGAMLIEAKDLVFTDNIGVLAAGVVSSAVAGYLSLEYLIKIVEKGKFHYFAYYCIGLGIIILALQLL